MCRYVQVDVSAPLRGGGQHGGCTTIHVLCTERRRVIGGIYTCWGRYETRLGVAWVCQGFGTRGVSDFVQARGEGGECECGDD